MALEFKNKLGLTGAVAVTIGGVIGVGIFVIIGPMGAKSGGWLPVAMLVAAVPAVFGTIVSAALGSTIPADGGAYMYSKRLMNKAWGAAASICVILGAFGAMGVVAIGVADYLGIYFPDIPRVLVAWAIIFIIFGINRAGVLATAWIQILLVAQLITALVILVIAGLLAGQPPDFAAGLPHGVGGFTEATIMAALAYTGFNIIAELGDEIKNPRRNIPLTIVIGLGIIAILYVGMGWVVTGNLSLDELKTSNVAAVDASLKVLPRWFIHYINLAAMGAAATSINAVFLVVPREFMALANDSFLPKRFLAFNEKTQTFTFSIGVVLVVGLLITALNYEAENYGIMAVVGLYLVNGIISFGCLALFKRFPEKVASSPLSLKPSWLKPCAVVSGILSIVLGVLGMIFVPVVGVVFFVVGGLMGASIWRVYRRQPEK
jgi:APA family basic amino acid/polyamine antiporter